MEKIENRPYQKQQPPQMPIVAVYFTDKQFEEIKQGVIDGAIEKLIREISKSKELDRIYFLIDYAKQISHDLYNFSNEIIKDDAK